ncbi:MAG: 30S ribosome-binding factor RbfA [Phycisphaerae bacterium]
MRPYRKEKVASVVRHVVGEAIMHRLNDPRVEPLTTVMRVEVTGDLLLVKVYLSIQGGETAERRTLRAMRHAAGFLQRMLARQLPIRHCPELRFEIDRGVKEARRTMELLEENRRLEPECFESERGDEEAFPNVVEPVDPISAGPSDASEGVGE